MNARGLLLGDFQDNAQQQYQLRTEKANELTKRLSRVRVGATKGGDTISFAKYFKQEFKVTRMREEHYRSRATHNSKNLLSLLALIEQADQDTPEEFAVYSGWMPKKEEVEPNAISHLAGFSGLDDESWAQKLVDRLDFKSRLLLDEYVTPDRILVEVNIAKDHQRDSWRALGKELGQGVSVGQGCTAILSIILLESEDPLIIDQPEDDLDNRFIYHEVVGLLRRERGKRQVIVATHNANIPVAGDAEMVIALDTEEPSDGRSSELQCVPAAAGFIDNTDVRDQITLILEGGEEAFRLRRQKYGF